MRSWHLWYVALTMVLVLFGLVLHSLIVVPTLRRRGHGPFTGWFSWHHYSELQEYRRICEAEGRSLIGYWTLVVLVSSAWILVAAWFIIAFFGPRG